MAKGIDPVKGRYYTCAHVRYYNPYNVKEDADKALEEWDDVCTELEIPHILIAGTCLGFYREGGYIQYDNDIDTAIICSENAYKTLKVALDRVGFIVGTAECFKHGVMLGVQLIPESPLPWVTTRGRNAKRTFTFEAFDIISYSGREYNVPGPVEEYLTWAYHRWWEQHPRLP